jgi:GntR family transcriptional repressor for pyruvate dehydrogenase complex
VSKSVVDHLTNRFLSQILRGDWSEGERLPTERALADDYAASRTSVRAAIGRLVQWRVIKTRQGSGAVALPRNRWRAEVLAYALGDLLQREAWQELAPIAQDAIALRRGLMVDQMARAARRVQPGQLERARGLVQQAWDIREDMAAFARIDRRVIPSVLEVAQMYASLWLMNALATPYLAVMVEVVKGARVPDSYLAKHLAVFDAVESGDSAAARSAMADYLHDVDVEILASLPEQLRSVLST